jgi:enoyl-CoA hydratase/carnithine racemase
MNERAPSGPIRDVPGSLRLEVRGEILLVALNRPSKRNALDDPTFAGIERVFSRVPDEVRAVVLYGEGGHFSAGLDLSMIVAGTAAEGAMHSLMGHRAFDAVQFGRVPVVAVMHGAVVGGGLELAAAAHVRVAEDSAFYALPEGQRGIFVGGGGAVRVPRLIGVARMTEMMLTGRVYSAEEGQRLGISHYLVPSGEGLARGLELARAIAKNAPATNFAIMHALPRIAELGHDQGMFMESLVAGIVSSEPAAKQRLKDFLEKRAPKVRKG